MSRAVAVESARGRKISKEKTSHKIDVVVAMAMAEHGAIQGQTSEVPLSIDLMQGRRWSDRWAGTSASAANARRGRFELPIDSCEAADAREDAQGDMRRLGIRGGRRAGVEARG